MKIYAGVGPVTIRVNQLTARAPAVRGVATTRDGRAAATAVPAR
jgi:hypothetical protein